MDLAKTLAYSVRDDETKRVGLMAGYDTIDPPQGRETTAFSSLEQSTYLS